MTDALLLAATWGFASLGFAALAFGQMQHWQLQRLLAGDRPPPWLRPIGGGLLIVSMIPAVLRDGIAFGLLLWSGMLMISGLAVVAYLARRRRRDIRK